MNKSLLTGLLILVILALAWLIIRNPEVTVDEPFEQPTSLEDGNASGSMFGFLLEDFNTIHALRWQPRKTMLTFVKFDGTWKVGEGEKPDRFYKLEKKRFLEGLENLRKFRLKPREISRNPDHQVRYGLDIPLEGEMDVDESAMTGLEITDWRKRNRGKFSGIKLTFARCETEGETMIGEPDWLGSILLGRPSDMPEPRRDMREPMRPSFYVRLEDSSLVYELEDDFGSFMMSRDLRSWRDKNVVKIENTEEIESVDVHSPIGDFLLTRAEDGSWSVTDRLVDVTLEGEEVDPGSVDSYLSRLSRWTAHDFGSEKDLEKAGFNDKIDNTDHTISILLSGDRRIDVKTVAGPAQKPRYKKEAVAEPEEYYSINMIDPEVVFKLRKWSYKPLVEKTLEDFRMKDVDGEALASDPRDIFIEGGGSEPVIIN